MLAPTPEIAMGNPCPAAGPPRHQSARRGQREEASTMRPTRRGRPSKHPRPEPPTSESDARPDKAGMRKTSASFLSSNFMNTGLASLPRMPWIKKLALRTGPVGVPSLSCITPRGLTHRSDISRRHQRPLSGRPQTRGAGTTFCHRQWPAKPYYALRTEPGPPQGGRPSFIKLAGLLSKLNGTPNQRKSLVFLSRIK